MNLYQLHSNPKTLYGYERMLEIPKIAYKQAEDKYYETGLRSPELEQVIGRDPQTAYLYAIGILRKRWPEGEPAIATSPEFAYQYARSVIKGRWHEAEPVIAKHPKFAYQYAHERNRTWKDMGKEEVESVIAQHPMYAYYYARWVMQSRWPEAEPYIKQDPVWWEEYVTRFKNQF